MHPAMRKSKVGRIQTRRLDFPFQEHTMPSPPKEAKEAHDHIARQSVPHPAALRTERKWVNPGNFPSPPKFCRFHSHARVFNTCQREDLFLLPHNRGLQCYYFPRLPPRQKQRVCESRKQRRQADSFFSKQELWGAWNKESQLPDSKQQKKILGELEAGDKKHTKCYYLKHAAGIEALRELQKRGQAKHHSCQPPQQPLNSKPLRRLKIRQELDLDEIKALQHWKPSVDDLLTKGFALI